jgi:hypothetical protein
MDFQSNQKTGLAKVRTWREAREIYSRRKIGQGGQSPRQDGSTCSACENFAGAKEVNAFSENMPNLRNRFRFAKKNG